MRILDRQRCQKAVYWGAPRSDGRGGQTFGTPIELLVRWEAKMQTIVDHEGQQTTASANVTVSDRQHVDNNGFMWLGTLANIPGGLSANPEHIAGAARIRNVTDNPDIRGRRILRKVYVA